MESLDEEIAVLKLKIGSLEDDIAAAKKEGKSEPYLINLGQQLVELRREKNLLLEHQRNQEIMSSGTEFIPCNCLFPPPFLRGFILIPKIIVVFNIGIRRCDSCRRKSW